MGGRLSRHYGPSREEETRSLLLGEHDFYLQDLKEPFPSLEGEVVVYFVLNEKTGRVETWSPEEMERHRKYDLAMNCNLYGASLMK